MLLRIFAAVLCFLAACVSGRSATVISLNTSWKYLKGFSEASAPDPTAWQAIDFGDTNWVTALTPFWYGDAQPTTGTQLTDMRGRYTCIFLRKFFTITDPSQISQMQLVALSDDGFIAWINGQEIARYNMPAGAVPYNGTSLPALAEPIPFETYAISNPSTLLVPGNNVLAIQAFNADITNSSDFVINVSLSTAVDTVRPTVANLIPPAGAAVRDLTAVEVHFSEPVTGVEASDLLINDLPAASVTVFSSDQYVFEFAQPPIGTVQVAWSPTHGIRDLASTPNDFAGGSWAYSLDPNAPVLGVVISEFMADNDKTINDENGDSSDWIEIYNAGTATANLNGWFLTTNKNNLATWRFPNVALLPGSYLLVFASGKDRTNALARLHTNFKLEKNGGYLALADSQTNVVSEFAPTYPPQFTDISYGRDRLAPNIAGYFPTPTPGSPNSNGGPGFAPEIKFSRSGGTFLGPFTLELSTPSSNAVIRYVLVTNRVSAAGTNIPTASSPIYTEPIAVTNTIQVRARAFAPGLLPGSPRSESYVLLGSSVVNFTSDLPLMIIHNFGAGAVPATGDQFAYIALFEPANGRSSLTNLPDLSTRAGINIRGSSTQDLAKKSFAVEWWDEFNADKDLAPLGMPADSDWVLYAPNNYEPVLIHNPFIYQLSRDIGRYAPRTRFVEVYVNTSGGAVSSANYNGVYVLEEKIKRGKDRVDIDKLEPEHLRGPEVTGGYMMKIDRPDPGDSGFTAAGQAIDYVDPKEREILLPQRDPQEQYIRGYMNTFGTVLNGANYRDPLNGYAAYVDVDAWIDHHLLNVLAFNVDALRLSAYFYKPREGKLGFGPIWDFDRSLGSTDSRNILPRVWAVSDGTDFFNYPWWGRLFTDLDFWQKWIDRWQDLRQNLFARTNLNALIDRFVSEVRLAQPREQARWGNILGSNPRGGSFQGEVNFMKSWLSNRVDFIDTNFLARPAFSSSGGQILPGFTLPISGPPGATIYYTLDGTDPRVPGGGVSPGAQAYRSPIALNVNARVVARAYDLNHTNLTGSLRPPRSSPWSGITPATFVTQPLPLVITEIMYHPQKPPTGNTNDTDNFEYLELKNVGSAALNLNGARFTNGIDFNFTGSSITNLGPGQYAVIVKNRAAFSSRYPTIANIAGEYLGSLDNGGERLALVGPLLEPILDFRYENSWYPLTDGVGFSLVIVNENAPFNTWSNQSSWRPSATVGGSPGRADLSPPAIPTVLITEALTHTELPQLDALELYNPNGTSVNVSGWFLTDDFHDPKKFRIPGGATGTIPAGGYRVFDERDFNNGSPSSFSLSSLGEQDYLFSADAAGNLTGYAHGFSFGAAQNGVSFGRYLTSDGEEHFVAQAANTLGAANAGPNVGPVVINEVMYQPPLALGLYNNTLDEYIELRNITGRPVPLYDPNAATNRWRIRGGVDFDFPMNVVVPAGGYLLVVSFDPGYYTAQLAAFRTKYNVNPSVPIFGPYAGKLENLGERINLLKPDPPQMAASPKPGFVPYVLVDQVTYSSASPWPTDAAGTGKSLQRLADIGYGDDPINWQAGPPTPGRGNAGTPLADIDGDGLLDSWELAHQLDPNSALGDNGAFGDPDHDGFTNLQEYLSGTDPRDASSLLKVEAITTGNPTTIHFRAVAGRIYSIDYADDLDGGEWTKLADVPAQPVTGEVVVTDPNPSASARFYRLSTPQTP
ncbi:MAG: hypothetical protein DME26_13240 [Verrucomicrobia bacterium]|nr:MAG: hypothetical protein DME26_13240 [Verrucomicrobiota bacterium]